ncbi:MAG: tyrosine--tRNA ligase, partial [Flavobacteriales bacterium]
KALANDIMCRVHSSSDLEAAVAASEILFGKSGTDELTRLDESTFRDVFEGVPQGQIPKTAVESSMGVMEVLVQSGFLGSNGEAKRALQEGSISVNKQKVGSDRVIDSADLLFGTKILLQRGKKNYFIVDVI